MSLHRAARVLLAAVVLAVCAIASALLLLASPAGNRWLSARLERLAPPGSELRVGGLETDLLHRWTLRNVSIRVRGRPAATVDRVVLHLDPTALLRGRLHVLEFLLAGVRVDARRLPDGGLDLAAVLSPGPAPAAPEPWGGLPFPISVDRLRLGPVAFHLDGEPLVADLHLLLRLEGAGRHLLVDRVRLDAALGTGALRVSAEARASLAGSDLLLAPLVLMGPGGALSIEGRVQGWDAADPGLDLLVRGSGIDLAALGGALGAPGVLAGSIGLELRLAGTVSQPRIEPELRLGDGRVRGAVELDLSGARAGWRAVVEAEGLDPAALLAEAPAITPVDARIVLDGRGATPGGDLEGRGEFRIEPFAVGGMALPAVEATVGIDRRGRLEGQADLGALRLGVAASASDGRWAGSFRVALADLAELPPGLAPPLRGALGGRGRFEAGPGEVRVQADLRGGPLRGEGWSAARIGLPVVATWTEAGGLSLRLSPRVEGLVPGEGGPVLDLDGTVAQAGERADFRLAVRGSEGPIVRLEGTADLDEGRLHAEAEGAGGRGRLDARVGPGEALEADLDLAGLDLAAFGLGKGKVDARLGLRGTARAPEGRLAVAVTGLELAGGPQGVDLRLSGTLGPGRLEVGAGVERRGRLLATAGLRTGWRGDLLAPRLAPDLPVEIGFALLDVDEDGLAALLPPAATAFRDLPWVSGKPPGLRLGLEAGLGGTWGSPRLDGGLEVRLAPAGGPPLRLAAALSGDGGRVALAADLARGEERWVAASLRTTTRLGHWMSVLAEGLALPPEALDPEGWTGGIEGRIGALALPLADLEGILALPVEAAGLLQGEVRLAGGLAHPRASGHLELREARVAGVELEALRLDLSDPGSGYDLDAVARLPGGWVRVAGHLPFGGDPSVPLDPAAEAARPGLDLEVAGRLPLALAAALDPALVGEADGVLRVEGRVEGSLAGPRPRLGLELAGGRLDLVPQALGLREIDLRARVEGDTVRLDRLEAETRPLASLRGVVDRPGRLDIRGRVTLQEVPEVRAAVELDHAWLVATRDEAVRATGRLEVEGAWPELRLAGELRVDELRYVLTARDWLADATLALHPDIVVVRPDGGGREAAGPPPPDPWERFDIALTIDLDRQAWVEAEVPLDASYGQLGASLSRVGFQGRLDGVVELVQRGGSLLVRGEVEVLRGRTTVLGRDFDLVRGHVALLGDPYDPGLDIEAVHHTSGYGDVTVTIGGSVEEMTLAFSSEEGWSETDIATLLLMGRPASELSDGEGGANQALLSAARAFVSQQFEAIGEGTGATFFDVEASEESVIGAVRIGWPVGRRGFLVLELVPSAEEGENTTQATFEWRLRRSAVLEVVSGDAGESSADVYLRWRF